jgi:thiol-disulfide isomerase/thioredoxin
MKKLNAHLLLLAGFLLSIQACSQEILISGNVLMTPGYKPRLYLVKPNYYKQIISSYEGTVIDSTEIAPDGTFRFMQRPWLREKGLYLLLMEKDHSRFRNEIKTSVREENFICLALEPGAHLDLKSTAASFGRPSELHGGPWENNLLTQLRQSLAPVDSLSDRAAILDAFLDTTHSVIPALTALRLRAPENEFRDRPEFFLHVHDKLLALEPGNPFLAQFGAFLDHSRLPVLTGEMMPDFALPDPKGDTIRLHDVLAPLLLVDFWASWCGPCREENRETLRPLYDAYHAKGLDIVGISIDKGRDAWMAAIRKDGAIWTNLSDLMGDASPLRETLKFEFIPNNYLLDGTGRLVGRNLHRDELKKFVEDYFKNR